MGASILPRHLSRRTLLVTRIPHGDLTRRYTGSAASTSQTTGSIRTATSLPSVSYMALTNFSDLVDEAREQVLRDAIAAGLPDDGAPLCEGGTGAKAYAEAVACT